MKPLILGVFDSVSVNGMSGASWAHPRNISTRYLEVDYWIDMARRLEEAGIDFLFLADGYGMPIVNGHVPAVAIESAIQFPYGDPFAVMSALAATTKHIGLVVTSSTIFEEPYPSARRFATLDHFSNGRIGWNVVTSASAESASAMFGRDMVPHDDRYDVADDYMELSYRLLEGCWEDGAVIADREAKVYALPDRVHRVDYDGKYFSCHGVFPVEPSPQRFPLIVQAGSSGRGREFAAQHAECVFLQGTNIAADAASVSDIRDRAEAVGRRRDAIKILVGLTVFTADTAEKAAEKHAEFLTYSTDESAAAAYAYNTGIDLLSMDMDKPLPKVSTEQGRTNVERFQAGGQNPAPSVRQILDELKSRGLRGLVLIGTPQKVADEIEQYVRATRVDGFLIESYLIPDTHIDLVDLLLPELRRRGFAPPAHEAGNTLRERLFGKGQPHLPHDHPGPLHRATHRAESSAR